MVYIILQYGCEPVLIQRILIGFEAILEKCNPNEKIVLTIVITLKSIEVDCKGVKIICE